MQPLLSRRRFGASFSHPCRPKASPEESAAALYTRGACMSVCLARDKGVFRQVTEHARDMLPGN